MSSFTELNETQWKILEPLMPPPPPVWKCGRKCTHWRKVLNTIFWILTTGARWKDVPRGSQWASRSSAHRFLGQWQEDGTWMRVLSRLEELAEMFGMVNVERLKIDGFFSAGKGGGAEVDYGYKGTGNPLAITTTPANGDERQQVMPLLGKIQVYLQKLRSERKTAIAEMDKGYDSMAVRIAVMSFGIFPWIPYRQIGKRILQRGAVYLERERWMVERAIAWLQKKFTRIVCRWERKPLFWRGFLQSALIVFWTTKIARHIG